MKTRIMLLAVSILISQLYFAQDSTKKRIKEIHLGISEIKPLTMSCTFKKQISKKMFFKIGAANLMMDTDESVSTDTTSVTQLLRRTSYGMHLGLEFRKRISERFTFFHGPGISYSYFANRSRTTYNGAPFPEQIMNYSSDTYGLGYTAGILFKLHENFFLGTQFGLAANYTEGRSHTKWQYETIISNRTSVSVRSSTTGNIILVYRF